MKKIFLAFIIIFFMTGCKNSTDIYKSLYIASIGIEKANDEYIAYFLLPSSLSVGSNKSEDNESDVAKVNSKSIAGLFEEIRDSSLLTINLKHISSFVLHTSVLNDEDIAALINIVKKSDMFDYNFYIFSTDEKIDDVFKIKNPNQESIVYTMLIEPKESKFLLKNNKPIHFLNMCRELLNDECVSIPYIELISIWTENDTLRCDKQIKYFNNKYDIENINH